MDQKKIGKFISEMRKQRGMTQKELAEKIGVSDKTISKWECGNSIPDFCYFELLCSALDISVNELLSGEQLSEESYSEKAEENMIALMKENRTNKRESVIQIGMGILLAVGSVGILMMGSRTDLSVFRFYMDKYMLLTLGILCIAGVLLSGKTTTQERLLFLQKTMIPNGVLISLFHFVLWFTRLDDWKAAGPQIVVGILVILYAVFAYFIITILLARIEKDNL